MIRQAMIRSAFVVTAIALSVGVVVAQQDPIAARRTLMKANGDQAKIGAAMAKGEAPFDLAKVKTMFATFEDAAAKMPALFPPNSKTGGDTAADPKIWENMDDFKARFARLGTDAKDAAAKVTDFDGFKAAFGSIGKNDCGGCHEKYRINKS
jgi:cytochrome c556